MDEFEGEPPSILVKASGTYPRLVSQMIPNTPTALFTYTKKPEKRLSIHPDIKDLTMFKIPICISCVPHRILDLRPDLQYADKFVFYPDKSNKRPNPPKFDDIVDSLSGDVQTLTLSQPAIKIRDLDIALTTKSTLVYIPVDMKLTDKHLAQMPSTSGSSEEIVWPHLWKFDENLGSFLCVVQRLDKNNYEFKVMIIPGEFTDDPITLAMLMKLFNPFYQNAKDSRETALKKARMMVASSANEFFGPQIVESCIAVWLSCRRNTHVTIKRSNVILKVNKVKLMAANAAKKKFLEPASPMDQAGPSRAYNDTATNRPRNITTTTKYTNTGATPKIITNVRSRKGGARKKRTTASSSHRVQPSEFFFY